MEKILSALLIFCLVACSRGNEVDPPPNPPTSGEFLSAGWSQVRSSTFPLDIFFVDSTGFTAGYSVINRSKDGGKTWNTVFSRSPYSFVNISMGDTNHALFAQIALPSATSSKLIRTSNGGNSFDTVFLADKAVSNVYFVSPLTAYAVGDKCWKTTDAGVNWQALGSFPINTAGNFRGIFFLNQQTGWVTGKDGVYKTVDGGYNWQLQVVPSNDLSFGGNIFFTNPTNGFVIDTTRLSKTINGGTTWNLQQTFPSSYHDIFFVSETTGYLTSKNFIYKTTDGGSTWNREVELDLSYKLMDVHFTDANHGWACTDNGLILCYKK